MSRIDLTNPTHWPELARRSHYSVRTLARLMGTGTTMGAGTAGFRQLQRLIRRQLGCTPKTWLDTQQMIRALQLLKDDHPVKCVSYELGFKHTSHFCAKFKHLLGLRPTDLPRASGHGHHCPQTPSFKPPSNPPTQNHNGSLPPPPNGNRHHVGKRDSRPPSIDPLSEIYNTMSPYHHSICFVPF
jgi:AraC-like DNA-binding protein